MSQSSVLRLVLAAGLFLNCVGSQAAVTRVLLPFYANPTAGAYGSRWVTENWFHYTGATPTEISPSPGFCAVTCTILDSVVGRVGAGEPPLPFETVLGAESGVLVHIPAEHTSDFTFASRIRDTTYGVSSGGTEVPVVPESRFATASLELLNIPVGLGSRNTLRVYALPDGPSAVVEVRYYRMLRRDEGGRLSGEPVLLRLDRVNLKVREPVAGYSIYPSYAIVVNFDAYPELLSERAVWVEVVPLSGVRIWAMVSVTSNLTQEVTIITPNR